MDTKDKTLPQITTEQKLLLLLAKCFEKLTMSWVKSEPQLRYQVLIRLMFFMDIIKTCVVYDELSEQDKQMLIACDEILIRLSQGLYARHFPVMEIPTE